MGDTNRFFSQLLVEKTAKTTDALAVQKRRRNPSAPSVRNACRAVMLVDGAPIRQKARRDYERVLRDLKQTRQELDRFENEDKPRYLQWLNRQFGSLLTALRETSQQLAAKEELVFEIESETFFTGASYGKAYQRVLKRRENPETAHAEFSDGQSSAPGRDGFDDEASAGHDGDPTDPLEDELNAFFKEMDQAFEDIFEGSSREKRRSPRHKETAAKPSVPRLKELYRAVVRRLHPDTQTEMTSQKLEWWHQAQEAYQKGDTEQLEVILSLCEIEERGTTAQTSVSLLARITRQIAGTLRAIKKHLGQCRHDPAWNFSQRTDRKQLGAQIQRHLEDDLVRLQRAVQSVESQLNRWAADAERIRSRRPRRKTQASQPEFLF